MQGLLHSSRSRIYPDVCSLFIPSVNRSHFVFSDFKHKQILFRTDILAVLGREVI
jgi:hypothetical protein